MRARVLVTLRKDVLDPQGSAVCRALQALGFEGVRDVRVGKLVELDLEPAAASAQQLRDMCEKLLANPVIEDFRFEVDTK
ncbi:MAG: phosphoribosylformylglycinamidine synthase subunit PurS [Proteobacteria bacterium]|nr:phosphoribosylformylglycinamidine synthase subunit PurS [Pseudomonadota bacterium]